MTRNYGNTVLRPGYENWWELNTARVERLLDMWNVEASVHNEGHHWKIHAPNGTWNFWPATGKWMGPRDKSGERRSFWKVLRWMKVPRETIETLRGME